MPLSRALVVAVARGRQADNEASGDNSTYSCPDSKPSGKATDSNTASQKKVHTQSVSGEVLPAGAPPPPPPPTTG